MHRSNHLLAVALALVAAQGLVALPILSMGPTEQAVTAKSKTLPQVKPYRREPSAAAINWANNELHRMSLDEKIGQLLSVGIDATILNQDSDEYSALRHQIEDNHVG